MNKDLIQELIERALTRKVPFPEVLTALSKEGVESYHVDLLRDEFRYYAKNGDSLIIALPLPHKGVAGEFSAERIEDINRRVQAGQASYADFIAESTTAGCAYYIVFLNGKMVRYFGRHGGEHVQYFPGSR
ncbi:MAG TPA: DUF1398 family protein [Candidatus Acidoferrum sp.]|nr:DUF1398 family protein [Candidatus Acidoferrum sp.]